MDQTTTAELEAKCDQVERNLFAVDKLMDEIHRDLILIRAHLKSDQPAKAPTAQDALIDYAAELAADAYGVAHRVPYERTRAPKSSDPRQLAFYLCYEIGLPTDGTVSGRFGKKRGAMLHAVRIVRMKFETSPHFRTAVEKCLALLRKRQAELAVRGQ